MLKVLMDKLFTQPHGLTCLTVYSPATNSVNGACHCKWQRSLTLLCIFLQWQKSLLGIVSLVWSQELHLTYFESLATFMVCSRCLIVDQEQEYTKSLSLFCFMQDTLINIFKQLIHSICKAWQEVIFNALVKFLMFGKSVDTPGS